MPNPIDGPAPVLRSGKRCDGRGCDPASGAWSCGAQPGHGGRVHVVFKHWYDCASPDVPEVWFSWPTAEALDADETPAEATS